MVDLTEDQFRVLNQDEQLTLVKSAVVAAVELDARLTRVFEDAIRHYHRALQYVSLIEEEKESREIENQNNATNGTVSGQSTAEDTEQLIKGAVVYFKRQRFLKAQFEEFKKEDCPVFPEEFTKFQKAESLAYAAKANVLTLDQTYKVKENADKLREKSVAVAKQGWTDTVKWFNNVSSTAGFFWQRSG